MKPDKKKTPATTTAQAPKPAEAKKPDAKRAAAAKTDRRAKK